MPSAVDAAKRELVKLLRGLAQRYQLRLDVSRDSSDKEVSKAFKKVSLRVHPDKGGEQTDFQRLSAANDTWQELVKRKGAVGRPPAEPKRKHPAERPHKLVYCLRLQSPKGTAFTLALCCLPTKVLLRS